MEGLNTLVSEWGWVHWVVDVLPLVPGRRSVREREWLEVMQTFGINSEDGKRIIDRLGNRIPSDHENLFGRY